MNVIKTLTNMNRPKENLPDWHGISVEDMSSFQIIALLTNGIITPANMIDAASLLGERAANKAILDGHRQMVGSGTDIDAFLAGASLKLMGLMSEFPLSLVDKADGVVANLTGTKSPLGEAVDGTRDFFATWIKIKTRLQIGEITPLQAASLGLPKILNAAVATHAKFGNGEFHTSLGGKIGEVAAVGSVALADLVEIYGTKLQIKGVESGVMPHEAIRTDFLEDDPTYAALDNLKKITFISQFTGRVAASAINLVKSGRKS